MAAKQLAKGLITLNVIGWITNSFLHYTNLYDPNTYGGSIQITVAFCLAGSLYFYLRPANTRWFGAKVEQHTDVVKVVSFAASCVCTFPALIFNVYPLVLKLNS